MTRFEFTKPQKREMLQRSGGICEAGKDDTEAFYGMTKGETCKRPAKEFDHVIADALKREKPRSASDGLHVCVAHHKNKTHGNDIPKIRKAQRIEEKSFGVVAKKSKITSRPFQPRLKPVKGTGFSPSHKAHLERMTLKSRNPKLVENF